MYNLKYWRQNSNYIQAKEMKNRICFSSVIRQKRGSQNVINKFPSHHQQQFQTQQQSLQELMEQFLTNPNRDFTLRFFQSNTLRACNSKQGFEEGVNQLDQWIHHQIQHNNKQNISDTQPRRQIPNQLMKFANAGSKSPRKLNQGSQISQGTQGQSQNFSQNQRQSRNQYGFQQQFQQPQTHKNADMKQICREYIQNKRNGSDVGKDGPVWRFNNQESQQNYQQPFPIPQKSAIEPKTSSTPVSTIRQQKSTHPSQSNLSQPSPSSRSSHISQPTFDQKSQVKSQQTQQSSHLVHQVQQITNKMAQEIENISQRILQERRNQEMEDQELLISQRESQERDQRGEKQEREQRDREQRVKMVVGEYLSMKNGASGQFSDHGQNNVQTTKKASISRTQGQETLAINKTQQKVASSQHQQNVGYSFSSDFQHSTPQQHTSFHKNQQQKSQQSLGRNQSSLNPNTSKISLPNIDQVKSQRDAMEKVQDDFAQSVPVYPKKSQPQQQLSIDKNYIKQIQSVSYIDPNLRTQQKPLDTPNPISVTVTVPTSIPSPSPIPTATPSSSTSPKASSLLQQIHKTSMSIEGKWNENEQENQKYQNQVVVSIAEKSGEKSVGKKSGSKNGSNKNEQERGGVEVKVGSFTTNTITNNVNIPKIQFKKIPSPDRPQKPTQQPQQPNSIGITAGGNYFSSSSITKPQPAPTPSSSITHATIYKPQTSPISTSNYHPIQPVPSSNIFVGPTTTTTTTTALPSNSSISYNNANMHRNNLSSFGQTVPIGTGTSTNAQYYQNSKQRQLKSSNTTPNNQQPRKLKITISPKYLPEQKCEPAATPTVNDFRLTEPTPCAPTTPSNPLQSQPPTKLSFTSTLNNYPSPSLVTGTTSNVGVSSSISNRIKLDSVFTSINTANTNTTINANNIAGGVTIMEKKEVQEMREKGERGGQALIRIQRYERVEQKDNRDGRGEAKQSIKNKASIAKNSQSIKSSQQFQFDLDF